MRTSGSRNQEALMSMVFSSSFQPCSSKGQCRERATGLMEGVGNESIKVVSPHLYILAPAKKTSGVDRVGDAGLPACRPTWRREGRANSLMPCPWWANGSVQRRKGALPGSRPFRALAEPPSLVGVAVLTSSGLSFSVLEVTLRDARFM